jgi:hypothetical protein
LGCRVMLQRVALALMLLPVMVSAQSRYLKPADFPELPVLIQQKLNQLGCVIPQSSDDTTPHNVVSGHFARPGQVDWAVICSKKGKSTVMVFWGRPNACAARPWGPYKDKGINVSLDSNSGKKGLFLRLKVRSPESARAVLEHLRQKNANLTHESLEYFHPGTGVRVEYCSSGRWRELWHAD